MAARYEMVPGTIYLIDLNHEAEVDHARKGDIVLIPQPSKDPNDPLRWSRWKKHRILAILGVYGILCGAICGYTAPAAMNMLMDMGLTYNDLSNAVAVQVLMAGWGNVWFTPMSHKLGRRFVYIVSLALVITGQAILYKADSRSMFIAQCFVTGVGVSPFEALIEVSISDIYFAHERGSKLGVYVLCIAGGSFLGPLAAGYVAVGQGWRWIPKWGMILSGILLAVIFLFLDETKFVREQSQSEVAFDGQFAASKDGKASGEACVEHSAPESALGTGRPWYKSLALWTIFPGTWMDFVRECIRPFRIVWFPVVLWSGIIYGSCVCWLSVQAVSISAIFAAPPYLFAPDKIGLLAIAPAIGTIFGSLYSGYVTNAWVLRMARRNAGFREPEHRLYSLIPAAFFIGGGLVMYGVGAAHGMHWILPAFGSAFVAIGLAAGAAGPLNFVIDSYKEISPEAITCVIVIRNTMGFGITYGAMDWIEAQGLQNTFITMGVLAFAIFMSSILFIIWGKRMRRLTAKSYLEFAAIVRGSGNSGH